eukprot:1065356-Ditylum_brightwellii.AAC.2
MVLLAIPTAVELLHMIGIGGWGCPISCNARLIGLALQALRNKLPNSASDADAATNLRIVHRVWMSPLRKMALPGTVLLPRKKCSPAMLQALGSFIQAASEWTYRIMSEV